MKKFIASFALLVLFGVASQASASTMTVNRICAPNSSVVTFEVSNQEYGNVPFRWERQSDYQVVEKGEGVATGATTTTFTTGFDNATDVIRVSWPINGYDLNYSNSATIQALRQDCQPVVAPEPVQAPVVTPAPMPVAERYITLNGHSYAIKSAPQTTEEVLVWFIDRLSALLK